MQYHVFFLNLDYFGPTLSFNVRTLHDMFGATIQIVSLFNFHRDGDKNIVGKAISSAVYICSQLKKQLKIVSKLT